MDPLTILYIYVAGIFAFIFLLLVIEDITGTNLGDNMGHVLVGAIFWPSQVAYYVVAKPLITIWRWMANT